MPSPFPGMDPYLERPSLWPDVHAELIIQIRAAINPLIRPKYVARVEKRVYISDDDDPGRELMVPDIELELARPAAGHRPGTRASMAISECVEFPMLVEDEIREGYVSIYEAKSSTLVTILEVLSPANKLKNSEGRRSFLKKRREVIASEVNWVEIDLLRSGERTPRLTRHTYDYQVIASRGHDRDRSKRWSIDLRQKLPTIGIPLKPKDGEVPLDLQKVLSIAYENAGYDASIDYTRPPEPPLDAAASKWANALLKSKGLR